MNNPLVKELLDKIQAIHDRKNADYAEGGPYENFERSAMLMSWFKHDQDKAFVNLIGTKVARLATLLNTAREPNNESIEDSFLDLCTYCVLWSTFHKYISVDQIQLEAIREFLDRSK